MKTIVLAIAATAVLAVLTGCEKSTSPGGSGGNTFPDPWPSNMGAVLTTMFTDPAGDQQALPPEQEGPPYPGPVPFPAVDVTEIAMGVDGDFLYMRVQFAGPIPTADVHIPADGVVEEQWVRSQGMNVSLNSDGNTATGGAGEGVTGVDVFFAVGFRYGTQTLVYANWDFPDGDVHHAVHNAHGELGSGGPGHDFVVARYRVADLGAFFPRGELVDVGSWSEAESYNADGTLKYHHFAYDRAIDGGHWTIPGQ